jgi:Zn finger protein HypA/HybF involved in hydrogenase expression/predicted DNA binding CopG/RHH family protein
MLPNNPLSQYFRQPAIHIRLPSQGNFYPDGTLDMPANGELPVYPMTAIDEITYRTPDALFNGSAVVSVIQSCIPGIKNAWVIPAVDIDTILISIRIASYGHEMEIYTKCPSCESESDRVADLRTVIDSMKAADYKKVLRYGDLEIFFQPMTYKDVNENNQLQFEEQRLLQAISSQTLSEEDKVKAMSDSMRKITDITMRAMVLSVAAIKTPAALVTDPVYIEDLLKNCDRKLFNQIRDQVIEFKTASEIQPLHIECNECHHQYQQSITLDMSSFFGTAS